MLPVVAEPSSAETWFLLGDHVKHKSGSAVFRVEKIYNNHGGDGFHYYYLLAPGYGSCMAYGSTIELTRAPLSKLSGG